MNPFLDLNEWNLYEREFDRACRDAAVKSFERLKKTLGVMLSNNSDLFLMMITLQASPNYVKEDKVTLGPILYNAFKNSFQVYTGGLEIHTLGGTNGVVFVVRAEKNAKIKSLGFEVIPDFIKVPKGSMTVSVKLTDESIGNSVAGSYGDKTIWIPNVLPMSKKKITDMLYLCYRTFDNSNLTNKASRIHNHWVSEVMEAVEKKRSIYIHEYTHHLDSFRYKAGKPKNVEVGNKAFWQADNDANMPLEKKVNLYKQYYTDDAELNAYYQEAMGCLQDATEKFLIAATSTIALMELVEGSPHWNSKISLNEFNFMSNKDKCSLIAKVVVNDFNRIMDNANKPNGLDTMVGGTKKDFYISVSREIKDPFVLLALKTLFVYTNAGWIEAIFTTPKLKRKILNRLYSSAQDIKAIVKDYENDMNKGKIPTTQAWNTAAQKMRDSAMGSTIYGMMYSGKFMRSAKPFDPRTVYSLK
jgi:hypothetical protein